LAARKWENLKDDRDNYKRRGKVYSYLQQKGYESSVIKEVIQELGSME
jgi:SOS response regulatory protein OraA/RecX